MDGKGQKWWGLPGIGYLRRGENRPRLFEVDHGTNILVENIFFKDSAYWTFWVHSVQGLEVRYCDIGENSRYFLIYLFNVTATNNAFSL